MSDKFKIVATVVLYLAAIVAATFTITAFGPAASIYNAFAFIGLTLITRDVLHDFWQKHRFFKMSALIGAGGLLTVLINPAAGGIAIASAVAFMASELVDYVVYALMENYPWLLRSNTSNMPSALVDSIIFPTLAFGGLSWALTLGQFTAKVAGGLLFSLVIEGFRERKRQQATLAPSEALLSVPTHARGPEWLREAEKNGAVQYR